MDTIAADTGPTNTGLSLLDLERLRAAPLSRDPFDFVVVENFVRPQYLAAAIADFPPLGKHGSFPLNGQRYGAIFARLAAELQNSDLRRAIEDKFALDLSGRPTMITLRGSTRCVSILRECVAKS